MTASERPPGAIVIGSDFRALGVVRSLGRRRVPCIVIDNLPRSAWFSRYVKQRIYWPGALDSAEFLAFLLRLADELCERETLDTPELLEIFGDLPVWESVNGSNGAKTSRTRRTSRSGSAS